MFKDIINSEIFVLRKNVLPLPQSRTCLLKDVNAFQNALRGGLN